MQYWEPDLIQVAGIEDVRPKCLNNNGQVVGELFNQNPIKIIGFYWEAGGSGTTIEEEAAQSSAYGINNLQQIVGASTTDPLNNNQAFLIENGQKKELIWLENGNHNVAYAVNDSTQVVGSATISGGQFPNPDEPEPNK